LMAHIRWEIPQEPGHWAREAWDLLNRSLSLSGTLKRGRVSLGGGDDPRARKATNVAAGEEIDWAFLERDERTWDTQKGGGRG
jgi:hypothetical protein